MSSNTALPTPLSDGADHSETGPKLGALTLLASNCAKSLPSGLNREQPLWCHGRDQAQPCWSWVPLRLDVDAHCCSNVGT